MKILRCLCLFHVSADQESNLYTCKSCMLLFFAHLALINVRDMMSLPKNKSYAIFSLNTILDTDVCVVCISNTINQVSVLKFNDELFS